MPSDIRALNNLISEYHADKSKKYEFFQKAYVLVGYKRVAFLQLLAENLSETQKRWTLLSFYNEVAQKEAAMKTITQQYAASEVFAITADKDYTAMVRNNPCEFSTNPTERWNEYVKLAMSRLGSLLRSGGAKDPVLSLSQLLELDEDKAIR